MSWKYVSVNDAESRADRQLALDRIKRFWAAFERKRNEVEGHLFSTAGALDAGTDAGEVERVLPVPAELGQWMNEHVRQIDPRMEWEFGQATGGFYLAITAGDFLRLRPMLQSVASAAPRVPGWQFLDHRPPLPAHWAIEAVRQRFGENATAPSVLARLGKHNRIDMIFKMRQARNDEAGATVLAAGLAEAVLGEEAFVRWVGEIDVEPLDRGPSPENYLGMSQLRSTLIGQIQTITRSLPDEPLFTQPAPRKWPTFKFDPTPGADYALQDDLIVGRSLVPAVRTAAFGEGPGRRPDFPFYSTCFSKAGEIFCYLKIDMQGLSFEARRRRKYEIEDRIDPALRRAGVGCVAGSGTGLRYVYLDLAVTELKPALAVFGPLLKPLELPERTWLLFCDSELADEHIGLLSSSGAPPDALPGTFEFSRRPVQRPQPAPQVHAIPVTELMPNELLF